MKHRNLIGFKRRSIHWLAPGIVVPVVLAESLEPRTLFVTAYDFVTFAGSTSSAATGDGALTITPNTQVTIRTYVHAVSQFGSQFDPTPTGSVRLEWFRTDNAGDPVGTQNVPLSPESPGIAFADVTVTLSNPNDPAVVPDQSGDLRLMGFYSGDSNLFSSQSLPDPLNGVTNQAVEPYQQAFMGVKFVSHGTLSVTQQPTDTAEGDTISPVKVALLDASGSIDTTSSEAISVTLASASTGAGTLTGTKSVNAVNGVASFGDLSIDKPGAYTLSFVDGSGNTAASDSFHVGEQLIFVNPIPSVKKAGAVFSPVMVELKGTDGNPDSTSTASVTLALNPFVHSGAGILKGMLTEPLVGGIATFTDLSISKNGAYQLHPSDTTNDTPVDSSRFQVGPSDVRFEIVSKPVNPKGAVAGSRVFYTILVAPKKSVQQQTIIDTFPAGFTPEGITAGFTISGNTITWHTNLRLASFVFDFKVPDDKTLSNLLGGAGAIPNSAEDDITYADSSTDVVTATNLTKLNLKLEAKGTVNDAEFDYPNRLTVVTDRGLAGIEVRLINSDGAVAASEVTTASGGFDIKVKKGGVFQLLFSTVVNSYSTAADGFSNQTLYFGKTVDIPLSNTTVIDQGKLVMPKTFFNSSGKLLKAMNNYTTTGFQGLGQFNINFLRFNTTSVENVLTSLGGTPALPATPLDPVALHKGTVANDAWIGALRMMAGVSEINQRFSDTKNLADQVGKALAVTLSAKFSAFVGKNIVGKFGKFLSANGLNPTLWNSQIAFATQKVIQAGRVGAFTTLGATLPTSLDVAGFDNTTKGKILAATFVTLRVLSDTVSGKLIDDLSFEAVFNMIRIIADAAFLEVMTGVQLRPDFNTPSSVDDVLGFHVPIVGKVKNYLDAYQFVAPALTRIQTTVGVLPNSMQDLLDTIVANRLNYNSNPTTEQMLTAMDGYDQNLHNEAIKGGRNTAIFNGITGLNRASTGIEGILEPATNKLSLNQQGFQTALKKVNGDAQVALGYTGAPNGKELEADLLAITFGSAAFSLAEQIAAATDIPTIVQTGVVSGIFGGQITGFSTSNAAATSTGTPTLAKMHASDAGATSASLTILTTAAKANTPSTSAIMPTDATKYLADLQQLTTWAKAVNINSIASATTGFAADDQALFASDLILLDSQSAAVLKQLSAASRKTVSQFDADLNTSIQSSLYLELQLGAWGGNTATAHTGQLLAQITSLTQEVTATVKLADMVRAMLAPLTIPGTISIEGTSVPLQADVGSTQTLTFTVFNVGSQPTDPGTIEFTNGDGSLIIQSAAQQILPTIPGGASATFTWQVQANAPAAAGSPTTFQLTATIGENTTVFADQIIIGG